MPSGLVVEHILILLQKMIKITITNLIKGDWVFTVIGLNSDGDAIGEGNVNLTVIPNQTISKSIIIEEYSGNGTFDLTVNWPTNDLTNPAVVASLESLSSQNSYNLNFNILSGTATSSEEIPAGFYILNIELYDGSSDNIDNLLLGRTFSLRIVKSNTTNLCFRYY